MLYFRQPITSDHYTIVCFLAVLPLDDTGPLLSGPRDLNESLEEAAFL